MTKTLDDDTRLKSDEPDGRHDGQRIDPVPGDSGSKEHLSGDTPPSSGAADASLAVDAAAAQAELKVTSTGPEKCSARNILDPSPVEPDFEEGAPRRHDPSVDAFKKNFADAQRLEEKISTEEARLEGISSAEAELEQKIGNCSPGRAAWL